MRAGGLFELDQNCFGRFSSTAKAAPHFLSAEPPRCSRAASPSPRRRISSISTFQKKSPPDVWSASWTCARGRSLHSARTSAGSPSRPPGASPLSCQDLGWRWALLGTGLSCEDDIPSGRCHRPGLSLWAPSSTCCPPPATWQTPCSLEPAPACVFSNEISLKGEYCKFVLFFHKSRWA